MAKNPRYAALAQSGDAYIPSRKLIDFFGRTEILPYFGTLQQEVLTVTRTRHRPCRFYS